MLQDILWEFRWHLELPPSFHPLLLFQKRTLKHFLPFRTIILRFCVVLVEIPPKCPWNPCPKIPPKLHPKRRSSLAAMISCRGSWKTSTSKLSQRLSVPSFFPSLRPNSLLPQSPTQLLNKIFVQKPTLPCPQNCILILVHRSTHPR